MLRQSSSRSTNSLSAIRILITCALFILAGQAHASSTINTLDKSGLLSPYEETGIAIRGYDTVAYFTKGEPTKGDAQFSVQWNNATWLFSSQEHATLFENDPEAYAPQYGGYCAYGVAQGYLVKIEVDQWRIEGGKLYLNYDRGVQKKWLRDIPGFIETANNNFLGLVSAKK